MLPEQAAAIDAWIAQQRDLDLSRPEAIRRLVNLGLATAAGGRAKRTSASSKSSELAGKQLDKMIDKNLPDEEKATRKRKLLKGPSEFREARVDRKKKT